MLSTARCSREHLRFRYADGIASIVADNIHAVAVGVAERSRGIIALTHVATLDLETGLQK